MTLRRHATMRVFFVLLFFVGAKDQAAGPPNPRFKAVAFDYFVIFDPNSAVPAVERAFPGKGLEFTRAWRSKQFEYSFLRSITNDHEDFFKVTGDALDYTAQQMHLELTPKVREVCQILLIPDIFVRGNDDFKSGSLCGIDQLAV